MQPTESRSVPRARALTVLLSIVLGACVPAQMRLPDGFAAQADSYEVSGHSPRRFNEPVRFGPYSALEMREGSTFAWAVPLGAADLGRRARPFAFTLVAREQAPVEVQCRARTWTFAGDSDRSVELDLTALAGPMLACGLRFDDGAALPLELARDGTGFHGRLASPWGEYTLRSVHGFAGSSIAASVPNGFEVARGQRPVALVDRLNAGRVHFDGGLPADERVYLAAAAAALLMLDEEVQL
ncbi:hypothetical protein ACFPOA_02670 [Lysobacter niabensis]|uniref:hypothetical protein n=1 Tax=Agrilutibacter niabensis TaxID=380628 RepID=UPI0036126892